MLTAQQQERREFVLQLLSSYALLATHACRLNLSPVELRLNLLQARLRAASASAVCAFWGLAAKLVPRRACMLWQTLA